MAAITTTRDAVTGAYPNSFDISATGSVSTYDVVINANGDLGGAYSDSTGHYVFTQPSGANAPTAVLVAPATGYLTVVGIDAAGTVYGTYGLYDPATQITTTYSFKDSGGTLTALAGPLGAASTRVTSVNADGNAVGIYTDAGGKRQAFVLSGGTATPIVVKDGANTVSDSFPNVFDQYYDSQPPLAPVDAAGDVAGVYKGTDGNYHAFLANLSNPGAGTTLTVDAQSSSADLLVTAVRAGAVVGHSGGSPGSAFYATPGNPTKIIGAPGGGTSYVLPVGFDGAGNVVGNYSAGFGDSLAFTYNPALGTSTDFVYAGAPPAGTTVQSTKITSTDAAGDVFGTYRDSSGAQHGFVDQNGIFRTVPGPAGTIVTTPTGVDAAGDVVGSFDSYRFSGSVVDRGGASTPVTLPGHPQPGGPYGYALYVDALGHIVGTVQDGAGTHGFVAGPGPATTFDGAANATDTELVGSDAAGDVAGYFYDANGRARGFVRAVDGTVTAFDGSPTATDTFVDGIDDAGEVFGDYEDGDQRHAFLRAPDGTITRLDPAGATFAELDFSDAAGDAAGSYETQNGGTTTDAGIFTRIGGKLTATSLAGLGANSIQEDSVGLDAVGDAYGEFEPTGAAQQAFFVPANGVPVRIAPADAQYSQIEDVNGSGTVAGEYQDAGGTTHGFVYAKGQFTPIDVPAGTTPTPVTNTIAYNVDAAGDVVGTYYYGTARSTFVRTAGGAFYTVAPPPDAVAGGNPQLAGVTASGVVAGYYDGSDGNSHLFIAQSGSVAATRLDPQDSQDGDNFVSGSFSPRGTDGGPANGVIAANYIDVNGVKHGLVYLDGQVSVVTGSATATDTEIDSVDAQGDIVGHYTDSAGTHAFVSFVALTPTIAGTHVSGTTGEASLAPFAGVTVGDGNAGATETLTITLSGAGGTLADGAGYSGLKQNADGTYTLTGSASAVTSELDALSFRSNSAGPSSTNVTTITLKDVTSVGGVFTNSATDSGTVVTDTAAPTPAPDTVSISQQVSYKRGAFTLSGTASSAAGVSSVEITALVDGVATDLGAAAVAADGTWTFADRIGRHTQGFITATETDGAGGTASAQASYSLQGGLREPSNSGRAPFVAEQDAYNADGSATTSVSKFRGDSTDEANSSRRTDIQAPYQTFVSDQFDDFKNNGAPGTTFVFNPGHGLDVVNLFRVDGTDHDTLSFKGSDFGMDPASQLAGVLANTRQTAGGSSIIYDPTSGDTVKLTGITKAQLAANQGDFTFHA